jgi:hypothetical protein
VAQIHLKNTTSINLKCNLEKGNEGKKETNLTIFLKKYDILGGKNKQKKTKHFEKDFI